MSSSGAKMKSTGKKKTPVKKRSSKRATDPVAKKSSIKRRAMTPRIVKSSKKPTKKGFKLVKPKSAIDPGFVEDEESPRFEGALDDEKAFFSEGLLPEDGEVSDTQFASAPSSPLTKKKKKKKKVDRERLSTSSTSSARSGGRSPMRAGSRSPGPGSRSSKVVIEKDPLKLEATIRQMKRENQAIQTELDKYKAARGKKMASLAKEQEMRLQANQDKYWLQQKLSRMQIAIQARLKMLGIDFSECSDLGEALDAAFAAIQKLSAALAAKERELADMTSGHGELVADKHRLELELDKTKSKLKKLQKESHALKKKSAHMDRKLSTFGHRQDDLHDEKTEYEKLLDELNAKLRRQQVKAEEQFDQFMEQKETLEQDLEARNEELAEALKRIASMEEERALLRSDLQTSREDFDAEKKKNRRLMKDYESMDRESTSRSEESHSKIQELQAALSEETEGREVAETKLNALEKRLASLEDELAKTRAELEHFTKKSTASSMKMQKRMTESKAELTSRLTSAETEKDKLKELLQKVESDKAKRDAEIADLLKRLAALRKEHNELLNRPREDKQTQTDIDGKWMDDTQRKLEHHDRLLKDYQKMGQQVAESEAKVQVLHDENKALVDEIDYLLKQGAKFRADTNPHTGGVHNVTCSPRHYIAASTATDCSVRLYKTEPVDSSKGGTKSIVTLKPYAAAMPEGEPKCVQFSPDGAYLAAGLAYKKGPDGAILVWDLNKGLGEVEYVFRSRPTVRFGIVHCLTWSLDNRYIFTGDTTGAVWVWDTEYMLQVAQINMHKDIVHDLRFTAAGFLFSCSLDQTISMFEVERLKKIKIRPERLHLWKPKKAKAKKVEMNERYPFWKLASSPDGSLLYAGARKLWGFKWEASLKELQKGPHFLDSDIEHIESMCMSSRLLAVCRRETNHTRIFDMFSGKELGMKKFKTVVRRLGMVHDESHMVVVLQVWEKGRSTKPQVKLIRLDF